MLLIIANLSERGGLLVTRWLTESSAYQPKQSIMVSHRAVDQFNRWVSPVQLINCSMGYHHRLSGFISRAPNQPPSYIEDMANRSQLVTKWSFPLLGHKTLMYILLVTSWLILSSAYQFWQSIGMRCDFKLTSVASVGVLEYTFLTFLNMKLCIYWFQQNG